MEAIELLLPVDGILTLPGLLLTAAAWPVVFAFLTLVLGTAWRPTINWLITVALLGNLVAAGALVASRTEASLRLFVIDLAGQALPLTLNLTSLGAPLILMVALASLAVGLFFAGDRSSRRLTPPLAFFLLMIIGAANGTLLSADLVSIYVFSWCFSLSLMGLVSADMRDTSSAAGTKAFSALEAGGLLLFAAILLVQAQAGQLSVVAVSSMLSTADLEGYWLLAVLLFVPFALRAAILPLHGWLTAIIRAAPVALGGWVFVCATITGVCLLAQLFWPSRSNWEDYYSVLGTVGASAVAVGALGAFRQQSIRPMLGFLAVAQMGYVAMGLGLGSQLGLAAALYQVVQQAIYLPILFLSLSALAEQARSEDIEDLSLGAKRAPLAAVGVVIGAMSVACAPALPGFAPRWLLFEASLLRGATETHALLVLAALASALLLVPVLRMIAAVVKTDLVDSVRPPSLSGQDLAIGLLAILAIILGLVPGMVLQGLVQPMTGVQLGVGPASAYPGDPLGLALLATMLVFCYQLLGIAFYSLSTRGDRASQLQASPRLLPLAFLGPAATGGGSALVRAYTWMEEGGLDLFDLSKSLVIGLAAVSSCLIDSTLGRLTR